MRTLDTLRAWGADVDAGLARCMGREEPYLRLVGMAASDKGFDTLEARLGEGDLKAAFEAAHGLKGSLGNLSLTPLYEPVCEITELLRAETAEGCPELMATIRQRHAELLAL